MKKINYVLLIIILGLSHHVSAQDGMILPMPGMKPSSQTSSNSNKANTNTQRNERQGQTNNRNSKPNNYKDPSGAILPLPNLNNKTEPNDILDNTNNSRQNKINIKKDENNKSVNLNKNINDDNSISKKLELYSFDDNLLNHNRLNNENEKDRSNEIVLTNYDEFVSNLNE